MKKVLLVLSFCLLVGINNIFAVQIKRIEKRQSEIGFVLGSPTGATAKISLSKKNAMDFVVGLGNGFMIHADYLWQDFDAFEVNEGQLPLYYGFGVLVAVDDHNDNDVCFQGKIGLEYLFDTNPLGIFIEMAPAVGTDFIIQGGIGMRFRLK